MMGKVKKPASASKEDGQKKISSFFQKPAEKSKPKALFTEHGHSKNAKKFHSAEPIVIPNDLTDLKTVKPEKVRTKSNTSEQRLANEKANVKEKAENVESSVNEMVRVSNSAGKQTIVTCIPETQVCFTPPGVKVGQDDVKDSLEANDFGLIPDTPQEKKEEVVKPKRPLGRSFLLSAAQMGTNPIQKAKEHRQEKLAMKKKVSQARKSLMTVSVQFNPDEKETWNSTAVKTTHIDKNINSKSENQLGKPDGDGNLICDGKTPTKIYSDGNTMKRMAKSGTSPDSKRILGDGVVEVNNSNDLSIVKHLSLGNSVCKLDFEEKTDKCLTEEVRLGKTDLPVDETDFRSAKSLLDSKSIAKSKEEQIRIERKKIRERELKLKQEKELLEKKRVAKEENRRKSEKLMKYQLTGVADSDEKYEENISVTQDDALDDILQELKSPSIIKPSKTSKSIVLSRTKSKVSEFTKTKPLNKRTTDKSVKHDTLEDNRSKTNDLEMVKHKEMDIVNDWTKEDDDYFSKLGVEIGVKAKSQDALKKAEEEFEIEHYLTPRNLATEGSRTPTAEMEIEEFATQRLDSKLLCDQMEGLSPFKKKRGTADTMAGQMEAPSANYGRHIVNKVGYSNDKHQMILDVCSQPGDVHKKCILSGFWLDSHIQEGDTVHILAEFKDDVCYITDQSGLLIINPDLLLSGTTVVSSVFCMRKSILKEKFKGCDSRNIQMLYGSIIHSVFQQMLKKKLCTADSIIQESTTVLKQLSNLLEMYANQVTEDKVMEEIKSYIPQMISWLAQYTRFGSSFTVKKQSDSDVQVTKVCDIEENMWSPRYGIKGKIDLTVEARIKVSQNEPGTMMLPLELKTGKTSYSVEHKGQVTLYSMMCGDRRKDPRKGMLLYLKEPSMKIIPADHIHQKGLIQLRNEMAYYISRQVIKSTEDSEPKTFILGRLPDPISNIRACQKCPQLINCSIYQRQVEGRSADSSGMSGLVNETLGHLTLDHMTYFIQWCLMLDLESQLGQSKKTLADIWCKSSVKREEAGLCLSGMVLLPESCEEIGHDAVVLTFSRHAQYFRQSPLSSVGITLQDSVVISREDPAWVAVCTGFVQEISSSSIQVLTERESVDRLLGMKESAFRIDKCDSFSTAGILYTNVSKLMTDDPHSNKLRRLLIDRVKPEFINTLSKGNIEKVKTVFKSLNKPQKTAILKVLMCKDYVLIRGYPGTGKTSTIVALVKVLYELGLSVLLTSYTHSAVDNILLKLKKDGVRFLRIGRVAKVHSEIRQFTMEAMTKGISTTSELEKFFSCQKIVATSCLGINHPVFTQRQFDVCIVDEASQVLQPACLGPLFYSKRFVLVGDPKQLPPVVQSKESRELGMDESLFCRLDGLCATFDLNVQYRMNREIMNISNTLVYNGCLKCGSDEVANQTLAIQNCDVTQGILTRVPWMERIFDSSLCKSVIVLDTQKLGANHCQIKTGGYRNEKEANIVEQVITNLCHVRVECADIGVIAPYRSQVLHIREKLGQGHSKSEVEVNTVDQYQGRDKNIIIISFVMSSNEKTGKVGELLQDIRRLNVAVTRARKKLILIGNTETLSQYTHLKQLLELLDTNNIIVLDKSQI